jgi:hypothetical protein
MAQLSTTTIFGDLFVSGDTHIDQVFVATGSGTDINTSSWNLMNWNNTEIIDEAYSFDGSTVTIEMDGDYEISAGMDFDSSGSSREAPSIALKRNGNYIGFIGRTGYMRDNEGHNQSSSHSKAIISASKGDQIVARSKGEADNSGSYSPYRCQFYIKKLHR